MITLLEAYFWIAVSGIIIAAVAGFMSYKLGIRKARRSETGPLKAFTDTMIKTIVETIARTIELSFTAWQGHLADREAMSCTRRCGKRRTPEEYAKEKLLDIANDEMWRQVNEEAGVEEGEEETLDVPTKGNNIDEVA